ncbi:transaldolase, partial [Leucobacter sp. M11]|uniref:transaldolase n=1 Tax=Leucobacter sp. M11 TaxID=2993565 RepID=UPI002D80A4DD
LEETVFALTSADVRDACDLLEPRYRASGGVDGRVSIEVEPRLAHDAVGTVAQARELWALVNRENAMIKIPATLAGLDAISDVIAEGISVNVTLIFSLERYRQVTNAYLSGLERARAAGLDLTAIHSVASFFVSRLDTEVDARLRAIGTDEALELTGKTAIANAHLAYEVFGQAFDSERFAVLSAAGAHRQRPLWASTGVKDPQLAPTAYVTELVAPDTVNTMPEATLEAVAAAEPVVADAVTGHTAVANAQLNAVAEQGIDYAEVTELLEREGLEKFEVSWNELLATVRAGLEANR